jgi:hypothetical protein
MLSHPARFILPLLVSALGFIAACGSDDANITTAFSCGELTDCGGVCIDTSTDGANWGMCDQACDAGHVCNGSACPGAMTATTPRSFEL